MAQRKRKTIRRLNKRRKSQVQDRQHRAIVNWLLASDDRIKLSLGAILLLAMFVAVIGATFIGLVGPEVLTNAFTLVLGYFFGSTGTERRVVRGTNRI